MRVGRDHIFQKIYVHISLYHDDDDGETCTHLAAAAVADLFLCYLDLRPMLQNFLCVCPNQSTVWLNGIFLKGILPNFLGKVAQISGDVLGYMKKVHSSVKSAVDTFWATFYSIIL